MADMTVLEGRWISRSREIASHLFWCVVGGALFGGMASKAGWATVFAISAMLTGGQWLHGLRAKRRRPLTGTAEGIRSGTRLLVRRDAIRNCTIEAQAEGVLVQFEGRRTRDDRAALVATLEDAERLVSPLDVPVRRSVRTIGHVALATGALPAVTMIAALVALAAFVTAFLANAGTVTAIAFVTTLALFISGIRLARRRNVELLADGLRVGGRGLTGRFVPYPQITSLDVDGRLLTIRVAEGAAVLLRLPRPEGADAVRVTLEERIDSTKRASAEAERVFHDLKDDADLIDCVRRLEEGRADADAYRAVAARSEDLTRAIVSPKMPRAVRVASAYVLSHRADVTRAELRRIAAETGDELVEGAILRIAEQREDELLLEHPDVRTALR